MSTPPEKFPLAELVDAFHEVYYHALGWDENTYLGYQIKQCPLDLQIYQELVFKTRPRFILQTGVAAGGSLLFFAHLLDLIGSDRDCVVVGVDIQLTPEARAIEHRRIRLVQGHSTSAETIRAVESLLPDGGGMVSLDSDHSARHVAEELRLYREYVEIGAYLVVEDTNINGHPVFSGFGPGPLEAVQAFLREDDRFAADDRVWRRNLFSFHQGGWLKRTG